MVLGSSSNRLETRKRTVLVQRVLFLAVLFRFPFQEIFKLLACLPELSVEILLQEAVRDRLQHAVDMVRSFCFSIGVDVVFSKWLEEWDVVCSIQSFLIQYLDLF